MKHDDFCNENYRLMREYKTTRKWRFLKRRKLCREINRRWNLFIAEISNEHSESPLPRWLRETDGS